MITKLSSLSTTHGSLIVSPSFTIMFFGCNIDGKYRWYDELFESKRIERTNNDLYLGHELWIPLVDDLLVAGGVEDLVAGVGVGVVIVVILLVIVVVGVVVLIRSIRRVACRNTKFYATKIKNA